MTGFAPGHAWAILTPDIPAGGEFPPAPEPDLDVRCHRRLRGPYTGGGTLLRRVVPELAEDHPELIAARSTEVIALAPELTPIVPALPNTLTNLASYEERTRFYATARTLRLAHGVTELLMEWARIRHPGGVVIAFHDLDDADPTDRELVSVLLRRCDPGVLTVVAETRGVTNDTLGQALAAYARRTAGRPRAQLELPPDVDLAQLFIDSDGTSQDPAIRRAYADLTPEEQARRHTTRAEHLTAVGEPTLRLGAIPYHLERGTDPVGLGVAAFLTAVTDCFELGFYEAAAELALRGRQIASQADQAKSYWTFTTKIGACLSYLGRGQESMSYYSELRRGSTDPDLHMRSSYAMAMLYTRHLPEDAHDEDLALEWINTAITIADLHPDPKRRVFSRAFMRNGRALVEMHRNDLDAALSLVNEAIEMTDADLQPDEHLLHRSVLIYNRAQVLAALGNHAAALLNYDEVIRRDPDYGDYYFERAAQYRATGRYDEALADYATAIRLSPPFYEAHYNRADLLRELAEDDAALRDLDYALELQPDHVDSLVNRADLLLAQGEVERAHADIDHGLALDPRNVHLLSARGSLLAESGDTEAAYASFSAALKEDPGFIPARANRAVLSYSAGHPAEAVDDLDHAIQLEDNPFLRANRAIALQDLDDHQRALEDLDIAIAALDDLDPDLLYRRGISRRALHDIDGAIEDWHAHLAAYGPSRTSPYLAQMQLQSEEPFAPAEVAETVT